MRKLLVANYSSRDYKHEARSASGYVEAERLGPLIAAELSGMQSRMLAARTPEDSLGFADVLRRYTGITKVEDTMDLAVNERKIRTDTGHYDAEMERLYRMVEGMESEQGTDGLVLVTPRIVTDVFPSYVSERKGFGGRLFFPMMFPGEAVCLDFEKNSIKILSQYRVRG